MTKTEILGYTVPWIVSPGEELEVKVSTNQSTYTSRVKRLIQGHRDPEYAAVRQEYVPSMAETSHPGRYQHCHIGSYAMVNLEDGMTGTSHNIHFELWMYPTLLNAGHPQYILSTLDADAGVGFALVLNAENTLEVQIGTGGTHVESIPTGTCPRLNTWAHVAVDISSQGLEFRYEPKGLGTATIGSPATFASPLHQSPLTSLAQTSSTTTLYLAAGHVSGTTVGNCFNGRLDSPILKVGTATIVQYDFARETSSDRAIDLSGHQRHATLVNAPTRGVKGYNWDGTWYEWTRAEYGYGAIHFHEDDLDDAQWQTDFSLNLPEDLHSGAYAVEIKTTDGVVDNVTFFVRRNPTHQPTSAKVALLMNTFNYLAYSNEHSWERPGRTIYHAVPWNYTEDFHRLVARRDVGLAMYDRHRDGHGVVHVSSKRPLMDVRTGYVHWGFDRPRGFSADLFMVDFLERHHVSYEVITDHDLNSYGMHILQGIDVLITGAHPEYPTLKNLQCFDDFAAAGGNLMYMGGNGFYWVTTHDPARPHRIEVRRGVQGCRAFELPAAEYIHAMTGEHGGLWRARGRPPNLTFGIGSAACGLGPGVAFKRTPASYDSDLAWMWRGIESEELIGDFGGGASGDELDRYDTNLGSPPDGVVVASSLPHSDKFGLFNEEQMFPMVNTSGPQCDKVRSDMVIFETKGRGLVWSVGSINWLWTMGYASYDNNVATLTWNVLEHFISRARSTRDDK